MRYSEDADGEVDYGRQYHDVLGRHDSALGLGRCESLLGQSVGSLDPAVLEVGGDPLVPRPAKGGWSLVVGYQGEGAAVVQVEGTFQDREQGQKRFSKASYGPTPVGDEIPPARDQQLQLGELSFIGLEFTQITSHAGLVGDDVGIVSIGLGLSTIGLTGSIHGKTGDVDNLLVM